VVAVCAVQLTTVLAQPGGGAGPAEEGGDGGEGLVAARTRVVLSLKNGVLDVRRLLRNVGFRIGLCLGFFGGTQAWRS
jgi:hypothetical protein